MLLFVHAAIVLNAANRLSPVWDEIVYPAAGATYWHTGQLWLNTEHGPLAKLISAAPLLAFEPELPMADPSWPARDDYRFGYQFIFHNAIPARTLIFWSRMPSVLFSLLTALLLFLWMRSIWGDAGGIISLLCYMSTPIFLSRASLALLEMPMYFFILLSLVLHDRWMRQGKILPLLVSGASLGLALLCKLAALSLVPTYFILEIFGNPVPGTSFLQRVKALATWSLAAALTIFLAYVPWAGSWPALKHVVWNLSSFDAQVPFYFHGRLILHAPAVLSWISLILKAPLSLGVLGVWGLWIWRTKGNQPATLLHLEVFAAVTLLTISLRPAVSTVQLSPFYLALAGCAGALGYYFSSQPRSWQVGLITGLLLLAFFGTFRVHPNYLAYFNFSAGGSEQGYRWLADSDQDWGQSLPSLASYLQAHGNPALLLAYSGAADPRAYGIRYQDLASPALVSREYTGERIDPKSSAIYLAVGTKVLQSEPQRFGWLLNHLQPKTMVDSCFLVYDVTRNVEAYRWMGYLYLDLQRYSKAKWAFELAQSLDPGNPADRKALDLLRKVP